MYRLEVHSGSQKPSTAVISREESSALVISIEFMDFAEFVEFSGVDCGESCCS